MIRDKILYEKLMNFSLDNPKAEFSFSDRLARENGWTKSYANRVVDEYKKFIYLSVVTKQSLTPSDEVDQAWHLHLIYSYSYWVEMCGELLDGFKLHHGPTKGGVFENARYNVQYSHTLEIYKIEFDEAPIDIWPTVQDRFSNIDFKRVSVKDNVILHKKSVYQYVSGFFIGVFIVLGGLFLASNTSNKGETDIWDILIWIFWVALIIFVIRGIYRYCTRNDRNSGGGSSSGGSSSSGCGVVASFFGCSIGCGSSGCGSSGCGGGGCGGCGGCGS